MRKRGVSTKPPGGSGSWSSWTCNHLSPSLSLQALLLTDLFECPHRHPPLIAAVGLDSLGAKMHKQNKQRWLPNESERRAGASGRKKRPLSSSESKPS